MVSTTATYIPLRVHSVYSRGKGAVHPDVLAQSIRRSGNLGACLAVSDPLQLVSWEYFYQSAKRHSLQALLGMEMRLQKIGKLLVFPCSSAGFYSLNASYNSKRLGELSKNSAIFIPQTQRIDSFLNLFDRFGPDRFYLGLQWHTPRWVIELSKKYSVPLVWTNPIKWIKQPETYAVVASVFNHLSLPEVINKNLSGFGLISAAAIKKRWRRLGEEAMANTHEIAARSLFDFDDLFHPADTSFQRLERESRRGIQRLKLGKTEMKRMIKELKTVQSLGFSRYFLIARDIAEYCRQSDIYFNLRGSGVGSILLYILGISRINPLKHDLLFERFINRLREDLPDIDIDLDSSRRQEVLQWVMQTYRGEVAFVSTHKFFKARSALYEVARVSGYSAAEAHTLTKKLPLFASPADLRNQPQAASRILYDRAALLNGVYKELSLHVGGVVFSEESRQDPFPKEISPGQFDQVIWDKRTIERIRLFKLDLLGVRGFDVISPVAVNSQADFDDNTVWNNIQAARTMGCFQLESPLARENLARAKPACLEELSISLAIIRPGPAKSGMKERYLRQSPSFHPLLDELFPYTRGSLIYEDQVTVLLQRLTGWSLDYAEKIRRQLKKKEAGALRQQYLEKGRDCGWTDEVLNKFWQLLRDFSLYSFSHSHSIAYAYSAYLSAWLKTHYPLYFFSRLFNAGGGYYTLPIYVEEAKRWRIPILAPDINRSELLFSVEGDSIRTGLIYVKGVGRVLAGRIMKERSDGYESMEELVRRARVGERALSALVAVSALGSIGCSERSASQNAGNFKEYLGFVPG